MNVINCGIDILTIFDAVFRYFPFFLRVLRYWIPPNVLLLEVFKFPTMFENGRLVDFVRLNLVLLIELIVSAFAQFY